MSEKIIKPQIDLDSLLLVNKNQGFSDEDSVSILYYDAISLKDGNQSILDKYHLNNYKPASAGKKILSSLKKRERQNHGFIPKKIFKIKSAKRQERISNTFLYIILLIISVIVFFPIALVIMNSLKETNQIEKTAFSLPTADTFVGVDNFIKGITESQFGMAFVYSLFITVASTALILLFTSMSAWFLVRVKSWWTKLLYFMIIFSMVVPFQMVMLPMQGIANYLYLDNIFGIILIYVGFGAGLSVFMYAGFVKSVPIEIEEAALIDGCNPAQIFFKVVFPVLKPTTITIAVLNVMWIWNDYLLPYRILGTNIGKTTIPVAIQMAMSGSYGAIQYGPFMAMIVLTIIPVIIFYLFGQKYIIKGVTSGAVKG